MSDEILTEVWAIKDAIAAQYQNNLQALFEDIKRGEAELKAKGYSLILPPPNPADKPISALRRTRFGRR
ncbi:MAG: hypothetical protein EXS11_09365 [Gemmataceae bacterium]|nr:hypothetical protein [Gemmataceae bacterium]